VDERNQTTRRDFIRGTAAAGAALITGLPGCAHLTSERIRVAGTPSVHRAPWLEELRIAFIGTGGMGGAHIAETLGLGVVCPCFCDVDTNQMATAVEHYPKAGRYQDYRVMFDKEHANIDAVMIATPDHHHYPATMIAMQLGKHVYTQKPLTHTPWEARQLTEAARRYRVATQMGNQGHAKEGWRLVYEWVHSGAVGEITEVHAWTDRPIWPQGMNRPEAIDPVPPNLDWDVWLGPAPHRPYKSEAYHPFNWRGWWDFGAGALGDMACHTMDGMWAVLDPGHPTAVGPYAATFVTDEAFPTASVVKWEFPATRNRRAFVAYWYDGGLKPPLPEGLEIGRRLADSGCLFVGSRASILVSGSYLNSPRVFPESIMKEIGRPPRVLERSPGHVQEWVMAAKGEKPLDFAKSNFAYAGPFTEAVLLGNVAVRMQRRLEWDGPNMRFTNLPEANAFVSKEYRDGWRF